MKIAMVSGHAGALADLGGPDTGGQNVHVAALSAALVRHGHEVDIYSRRDDPKLPERAETPQGYTVVRVPAGPAEPIPADDLLAHMGPFARFLDEQWQNGRPDIVHAHFWMSGIATQLAARHLNLPAVQTFDVLEVVKRRHPCPADTSPADRMRLEALLAKSAACVIATSTDEVLELMRMGRSRSGISVVPCGVDVDHFTPEGPMAPRGDRNRIVCAGKLVPRKGFDDVIRALPGVPNTELVIIGGPDKTKRDSDPEAHRLSELADELGVADRVSLYGSVARRDMPALLRSADVVACTPWYEPFGVVPLEAMACGVPVVASAVGGMRDTVVHDVTGYLVEPHRPDQVAYAINQLMRDDFRRKSMGATGRDRARARYSWDRIAADTQRVYDGLIAASYQQPAAAV